MTGFITSAKKTLLFSIILFSLIVTTTHMDTSQADLMYLEIIFDVHWNEEEFLKPIVPVDEIRELNLTVDFEIKSDEFLGKGALINYVNSANALILINLEVVDKSPWCSVTLKRTTLATPFAESGSQNIEMYLTIDEDAPSFADGFIKIKTSLQNNKIGMVQGSQNNFTLSFTPGFKPKIRTTLPDLNTKRVNPNDRVVFPIDVENMGNSRTTVLFDIVDKPKDWEATITNEIILEDDKGSKGTAYLTVFVPNNFGYHMDEANIEISMTPVRAEDNDDVGNPLSASFTIQSRGFTGSGIEQYIFYIAIIGAIVLALILIYRIANKKKLED